MLPHQALVFLLAYCICSFKVPIFLSDNYLGFFEALYHWIGKPNFIQIFSAA
jgi:hypothetical protein